MKVFDHSTAKPSHYNKGAEHYDIFNEDNSKVTNKILENIFSQYKVRTILDLTCGTGSQVFSLSRSGYEVVGSDISSKMLSIARRKAKKEKLDVKLLKGDMRTIHVGEFDSVITIFNAIGHLTKLDFEQAMQNIGRNLKRGGLYVFDIFNLSYILKDDRITSLTIDFQKTTATNKIREIQYSTIDADGILASYTTSYMQIGVSKPKILREMQTLQIYTAKQLKEMLHRNGFKVLKQCGIDGSSFIESETERILMVAQKQ